MRSRNLNLTAWAAALVTISFLAADLHAGKKPDAKPKEAPEAASAAPAVPGPEIPNLEFITRLRQEEYNYSQVMDLMSHLTDDIGPRLTGSPNMKKANEWTRDEFAKWGLANAHLESWGTVRARLGLPTLRSPHDLARLHAIPGDSRGLDAGHQRTAAWRSDTVCCLHRRRPGEVSRQTGGQNCVIWRSPHACTRRQASFQPRYAADLTSSPNTNLLALPVSAIRNW